MVERESGADGVWLLDERRPPSLNSVGRDEESDGDGKQLSVTRRFGVEMRQQHVCSRLSACQCIIKGKHGTLHAVHAPLACLELHSLLPIFHDMVMGVKGDCGRRRADEAAAAAARGARCKIRLAGGEAGGETGPAWGKELGRG